MPAAVAIAIVTSIISCDSETAITNTQSGPSVISQESPTVMPQEVRRSDGGTTFVREDGWPIPSFGEAEREEFETSITTARGRSVQLYRTVIRTDPQSLFTGNPLHLIGVGSKDIRINTVKEYQTLAGIFCYKFLVNDADVDVSTNEVRATRRFLYAYAYYDEDGDGVFESLTINEKDRFERNGFESEPHVPEWAIARAQ